MSLNSNNDSTNLNPTRGKLLIGRTFGARLIASLSLLIASVSLYNGTQVLAANYQNSGRFIDSFLVESSRSWTLFAKNNPHSCIGHLESELKAEGEPEFSLRGELKVSHHTQASLCNFSLNLRFSPYKTLKQVEGRLTFGESSFVITQDIFSSEMLIVRIKTPHSQRELTFPLPQPIYLSEVIPKHYSLRFPPTIEGVLQNSLHYSSSSKTLFTVTEATSAQTNTCQQTLRNKGEALDLDPYHQLLTIPLISRTK